MSKQKRPISKPEDELQDLQNLKIQIFDEIYMLSETGQITLPKELADRIFDITIQEENVRAIIADQEADQSFVHNLRKTYSRLDFTDPN